MADSITGRDRFIIGQALVLAIAVIDRAPDKIQEFSNRQDMMDILTAIDPHPEHWALIAGKYGFQCPEYYLGGDDRPEPKAADIKIVWENPDPATPT